jgi:hypothetical protein
MAAKTVRIGCGSAYAEDRVGPAAELVDGVDLDFLSLDCLAERTLGHAQLRKLADPTTGYDLRLDSLVREIIARCLRKGTKFIANMGAANPRAGAQRTCEILRELGFTGVKVAAITGDDVLETVQRLNPIVRETGRPLSDLTGELVSANAYIGAQPIVDALQQGADVVIGGRIADPSLFLAPAIYGHGWAMDDWDLVAAGQMVGHLLECGTYVTGGNWVDPPYRTVPDLWNLGLPYAEVSADGSAVVSKAAGTGGAVSVENCKAEIIYEIGDPAAYMTPDVVLDFTNVRLEQVGPDRVRAWGARGRPAPDTLKVLVGMLEGWIGEGEISFGGLGALARAELCADTIMKRLAHDGIAPDDIRVDYIGVNSVFGEATPARDSEPWEVRLRVAARSQDRAVAERVAQEVDFMYMLGPAGGGGVRRTIRQVLGMSSLLLSRDEVNLDVEMMEV